MITEKRHYYWLDLIRFISALLVVMVHVRCEFFMTYSKLNVESQNYFTQVFYFFNSFGYQAVLIFFILSGFLVGGRNIDKALQRKFNIKDYIIDRSVRILLPLLGSLIIVLIIDLISNGHHSIGELLGNLLGLQGVIVNDAGGVFWTLAYEIWFYILIGSIIHIITNNTFNKFSILLFTISIIIFTQLKTYLLFFLLFGILAYYISKIKINHRFIFVCAISCIIIGLLINFCGKTNVKDRLTFDLVSSETISIIFGILMLLLISQIVNVKPKGIFISINKYASKLSLFSYSLYITHYQCCRIMHIIGVPQVDYVNATSILYFFIEVIVCIIFAYLFYLVTEKHTSKLKKIIKSKI